jgi:serine/threonine protein kinase
MSPEQLLSGVADARSDQFSFSVALYEGLYRERPFDGATLDDLAEHIISGRVRLAPTGTEVPRALREILLRGMERKPERRYASMDELLNALAQYLIVVSGVRAPLPKKTRGIVVASIVLTAAVTTALLLLSARDHHPQPPSAKLAPQTQTQPTTPPTKMTPVTTPLEGQNAQLPPEPVPATATPTPLPTPIAKHVSPLPHRVHTTSSVRNQPLAKPVEKPAPPKAVDPRYIGPGDL